MSRKPLLILFLVAALAAGPVVGCGGGEAKSSTSSASEQGMPTVTIKGFAFKPATITVSVGERIRFTNDDATNHTATASNAQAFDTGTIRPGTSGTVNLTKPGTYTYECSFHPFMQGVVKILR